MSSKVEKLVYTLTKPITDKYMLELVDVEYKKEGQNWYLRIYIDKEQGVNLDDCQLISEELSIIMDDKDPITDSYFLEVSSPGLDRPLKKRSDFLRYLDKEIEVTLYQPLEKQKYYKGINKGIENDTLTLILNNNTQIAIPLKSVASAKLYFEF